MNPPACGHPLVKGDEGTEQKKGEQVMELSKLSLERLEGVDERLKAIVIECAARCPYPFNVSEGLRTKEQQREYVRQGKSRTINSKYLSREGLTPNFDGVPFAAILTISDPKGEAPVNTDMKAAMQAIGVQLSDIQVAARVRGQV